MQSEPGRYINSVSDLYGADEIEVLLEEIRDLEPASCRPEDIQDFEIAGSQTGVATTEIDCESPAVTVRSWDSHANYRHQLPESPPTASLFSGVILYCDETHLKSSTGVVRVLLVVNMPLGMNVWKICAGGVWSVIEFCSHLSVITSCGLLPHIKGNFVPALK